MPWLVPFESQNMNLNKDELKIRRPSNSISTYADHIEAKFTDKYDRYLWLKDFLRNSPSSFPSMNLPLPVEISIIDSEKENIQGRRFKVGRNKPIDPNLIEALQEEPSELEFESCQNRLIFFQYRSFESINPACIDLIGLHYDLHPDFFSVHFECDLDQTGQVTTHLPSHSLPSERHFLQIRTDEWTSMTATWKIHGNRRTFIVLALDHYLSSGDQLSLLYDQLVYHTPASEILRLNQNPADYLFPYVRESARYGASICAQLAPFRGGHKISQDFNLDTKWEINQQNRRAMMFSLTSLSRFLADSEVNLNPQSSSLKLYGISSDYRELIMESEMIAADLQVLLQQQAHLANIQEARRGVEQADSVRRLTILAFLFIPLSFTTSFFGMNIKELGTGSLSIGYFFLLAVLSGALCILVGLFLMSIERYLKLTRRWFTRKWIGWKDLSKTRG